MCCISRIKKISLLTFVCLLFSFDSQEHKIIGDVGMSRVDFPQGWKDMLGADRFVNTDKAGYLAAWKSAKVLAAGYDTNNDSDYSKTTKCQDNCYWTQYMQLSKDKKNFIENKLELYPDNLVLVEAGIGSKKALMSFGDLVALYGDFRRTVYEGKLTQSPKNLNIKFNGTHNKYCPSNVDGELYLKSIAFGLWPPFGSAGNFITHSKFGSDYNNAGWWGDEMMRLANVNETHFSNVAVAWYVGMHRLALFYVDKALEENDAEFLNLALHYEASALHCLTDLFAFGHVVTNRDQSSYGTMKKDALLDKAPYLWMENTIRLGGGTRDNNGLLSLNQNLPEIETKNNVRDDFLPSYFSLNPATTWANWARIEHDYHDKFNKSGAKVRNFNGSLFRIYGDGKLHDLDVSSRRVIEDAVTASVQSLANSFTMIGNGYDIDEISKSKTFFDALNYIPVYIHQEVDNYFKGKWTSYAEFVSSTVGLEISSDPSCKITFLSGKNYLWPNKSSDPCSDFSPYVTIGNQVFSQRNLDVSTYRDGTPIPEVQDPDDWSKLTTGAWCYANNDPTNGDIYGKLYNWYAVAGIHDNDPNTPDKVLAPVGWHIPSAEEWNLLAQNLGGQAVAGGKMKQKVGNFWQDQSEQGDDSSGFSGLPGGSRGYAGAFAGMGRAGFWFSSEDLSNDHGRTNPNLQYGGDTNRFWLNYTGNSPQELSYGQSVRLIRD